MTELDLAALIRQLRPSEYLSRTNDWIRGSLPRSSFRIGSPSSERPGPQVDRTDQDVLAERERWRGYYLAIAAAVQAGDQAKAARLATQALHIEHVALDEKLGLESEAGWPCRHYGRLIYGRHCMTNIHDHPNAECQSCRDAKHRIAKEQKEAASA